MIMLLFRNTREALLLLSASAVVVSFGLLLPSQYCHGFSSQIIIPRSSKIATARSPLAPFLVRPGYSPGSSCWSLYSTSDDKCKEESARIKTDNKETIKNTNDNFLQGNGQPIIRNINGKREDHNSTTSPLLKLRQTLKDTIFLGIDPSPDILAIATIYFVEGALGLARLAQTFLLKDELHLGPAELSALTGLFVLPWTIKPLYGFLSDGFPLFGYKRRSYLVVAGLIGCLSYTTLGHDFFGVFDGNTNRMIQATVASMIVSSACIACSDVVADGLVVQKTRESDDPAMAGGLQSLCWGSASIGAILSAYYSGSLLEVMKPQDVFQLTAILPFMVACIALLIDEKPVPKAQRKATNGSSESENGVVETQGTTNGDYIAGDLTMAPSTNRASSSTGAPAALTQQEPFDLKGQVQTLWDAFRQPSIWKPTLFLFLWQSTPTSDGAFLYFMTDDLGFGPEFLGRARLVTAGASLLGVWVYNSFLKTVPIKDILFWSSIVAFPLGMTSLLLITHVNRDLGIPDNFFVLGDDAVLAILGEISFMPILVLAARLCPPGVEAVLFATLMSINNGAGTVGTEIGALLTKWMGVTSENFDNLALLTVICNVSSLYPLLFINWLDEVPSSTGEDGDDDGGENGSRASSAEETTTVATGSIAELNGTERRQEVRNDR